MSKTTTKTSRTAPKVAVAAKSKTAGIRSKVVGTLKNAKTMAVSVRNKTVAGAKATDKKKSAKILTNPSLWRWAQASWLAH